MKRLLLLAVLLGCEGPTAVADTRVEVLLYPADALASWGSNADVMRHAFDIDQTEYIERNASIARLYFRSALQELIWDSAWIATTDTNPDSEVFGKIQLASLQRDTWEYFIFYWDVE